VIDLFVPNADAACQVVTACVGACRLTCVFPIAPVIAAQRLTAINLRSGLAPADTMLTISAPPRTFLPLHLADREDQVVYLSINGAS
jgi:hypothetical protein